MIRMSSLQTSTIPRNQRGISLLVVLILLVVMSILGLAVLRSSGMQERMSANMVDRNEAMQAAEIGLQVAQQTVIGGTFNAMWNGSQTFDALRVSGGFTCAANGYCDRSLPGDTEAASVPAPEALTWWRVDNGTSTTATTAGNARYGYLVEFLGRTKGESSEVQGVCNTTSAPRYLCERPMFRVTSYGRGRGLAQVVLQANILSQPR